MIIVTGTRRSGTSMWMQVLEAAGLPVVGERFPLDWGTAIAAVNPHGFYESTLRDGIHFGTNPERRSGEYLHPVDTRMHAVKVFPEGLVRSDLGFLDRVVVTMRPWQHTAASMDRLIAIEGEARGISPGDRPPRLPGPLEWWVANFGLVRDAVMRRYAMHMQSYASLLTRPREVVPKVLAWIAELAGEPLGLDVEAAIATVRPEAQTIHDASTEAIEPDVAAVLDEFYQAVHGGGGLSAELLARMNALHVELTPRFAAHEQELARWLVAHATSATEPLALPR